MTLLVRWKEEIAEKRLQMKNKVLFHQDNALCHKSIEKMAKLHELYFEMPPNPKYSSDLAPSDYYLFEDIKRILQIKRLIMKNNIIHMASRAIRFQDHAFLMKFAIKFLHIWGFISSITARIFSLSS